MSDWLYTKDVAAILREYKPVDLGFYEWTENWPISQKAVYMVWEEQTTYTNYYKADTILCHLGVPYLLRTLPLAERNYKNHLTGINHATYYAYQRHKCRCDECREWWNAKKRAKRQDARMAA